MKKENEISEAEGCAWCQCRACLMWLTVAGASGRRLASVVALELEASASIWQRATISNRKDKIRRGATGQGSAAAQSLPNILR